MGRQLDSGALRTTLNEGRNDHTYTVVVPIFDDEQAEWIVQVALALARPHQGRVVLVGIVRVPEGQSLSTGAVEAQTRRATLEHVRAQFPDEPLLIKLRIRVDYQPWRVLTRVVAKERADLAIVRWNQEGARPFFAMGLDKLLNHLDCHVVVLSGSVSVHLHRILMPIRGSAEAPLMLEVALSLAEATDARITMLYARRDDRDPQSRLVYEELARMSQGNRRIERELQVDRDVVSAVLEQVDKPDLIVMGAAEAASGSDLRAIGPTARRLRHEHVAPLVIVKTHRPLPLGRLSRWRDTEPLPPTPTSVVVDKWFAENTFHSVEFEDIERLVALKREQGVTISLGLPALNEETTVGTVIRAVRQVLMDDFPLLDEIVLVDSGSTDYTVEIAQELGVAVYQHSEILPQYGSFRGKGEALWKSLYVLGGDLIAWIDTDIVNIHPRFVYGILGPLLRHDTIQYVKGFYRRPLQVGETLQAGGGGRVTELVARPLINLFYPELSGLVQPLAGEYAGRRTALERLPFYTGYGVEIGLLLALVERYGISGIAQVDLRTRVHHNQPLGALSRMAFAIIQVFIDHLEGRKRVELLNEINRTMKIIRYEPGRFSLEEHAISDRRRPPIITLPEYRARHGITYWKEDEEALQGGALA
ncbi:MAG: glucosyl-3-phosphoglycerate synthase [Ardenticatenaceae bacterium]|nr:glucosyl-3-phosphoglycerate synthase [Ardenticatenaceae bacterium]